MPRSNALVRDMQRGERREVVAVSARAFWQDPLFDYFSPDLLHQYRLLVPLLGSYLGELWSCGAQTTVAEWESAPRSIACWMPPDQTLRHVPTNPLRLAQMVSVAARSHNRRRGFKLLNEVERRRPTEPHWYLALLATDPHAQGHGLASQLMEPILASCDRDGVAAYLETQKAANVSWYRRFGFDTADEVTVAGAPAIWCLRREPS